MGLLKEIFSRSIVDETGFYDVVIREPEDSKPGDKAVRSQIREMSVKLRAERLAKKIMKKLAGKNSSKAVVDFVDGKPVAYDRVTLSDENGTVHLLKSSSP